MEVQEIAINPEFEKLIPPLSKEEFEQLEKNILSEGIRDALVVWNGILLDGHNRYRIAEKHGLGYDTVEKNFDNEEQAKEWIILNQFGRRNLSAYQRSLLALELEELFSEKAKERMLSGKKNEYPTQIFGEGETMENLAKIAGVSDETLRKTKKIKSKGTEQQKEMLSKGKASIDKVFKDITKEEKKQEVKKLEAVHQEEIKTVSTFDIDIFNTDKRFNIIYADPAWSYWEGGEKNQSLHYSTMSIEDIKNLPVNDIAAENSILFIWVTFPILKEAIEVLEAWGFKYSTCGFVWVKKNKNADSWFFGNGAWTRANSELCLIGTKGSVTRIDASISQVLDDRIGEHSEKPARVRQLITKLVGELPRIELFSRNQNNDGWFNWGNKI